MTHSLDLKCLMPSKQIQSFSSCLWCTSNQMKILFLWDKWLIKWWIYLFIWSLQNIISSSEELCLHPDLDQVWQDLITVTRDKAQFKPEKYHHHSEQTKWSQFLKFNFINIFFCRLQKQLGEACLAYFVKCYHYCNTVFILTVKQNQNFVSW